MPRVHRRGRHQPRAAVPELERLGGEGERPGRDRGEQTVIFNKTKMCKFQILGMCSKGESCRFAHHKDELQSLPDLSCTKLCKTLIAKGSCEDPDCRYAHNKEELRAVPEGVSLFGAMPEGRIFRTSRALASMTNSTMGQSEATDAHPAASATNVTGLNAAKEIPLAKRADEILDGVDPDHQLIVRNSFLDFETGGTMGAHGPRSNSWVVPPMKSPMAVSSLSQLAEEESSPGADTEAFEPAALEQTDGPPVPQDARKDLSYMQTPTDFVCEESAGPSMSVLDSGGVIVKNTFLQFIDQQEQVPLRAVRTAAGRLDHMG